MHGLMPEKLRVCRREYRVQICWLCLRCVATDTDCLGSRVQTTTCGVASYSTMLFHLLAAERMFKQAALHSKSVCT